MAALSPPDSVRGSLELNQSKWLMFLSLSIQDWTAQIPLTSAHHRGYLSEPHVLLNSC